MKFDVKSAVIGLILGVIVMLAAGAGGGGGSGIGFAVPSGAKAMKLASADSPVAKLLRTASVLRSSSWATRPRMRSR